MSTGKTTDNNQRLDFYKAIACIGIVWGHTAHLGVYGVVITVLTRWAVPLFFAISGYFTCYSRMTVKWLKSKIYKLLKFLGVGLLLGIIQTLIFTDFKSQMLRWHLTYEMVSFHDWIHLNLTKERIIWLLGFNYIHFFDTTAPLWYILAAIYVYIAAYLLIRKLNLSNKSIFVLAAMVFCFYWVMQQIPNMVPNNCYYRNWLFMGLPSYLLGYLISFYKELFIYNKTVKIISDKSLLFILIGCGISIFEYLIWGDREAYFGSYLIVFVMLVAATCHPLFKKQSNFQLMMMKLGSNYSQIIYISHTFIYSTITIIVPKLFSLPTFPTIFVVILLVLFWDNVVKCYFHK